MWAVNPGDLTRVYKPTASTGTITNPGYAYDVDVYPWSTYANRNVTGSAVHGTPDIATVVFDTFSAIAKGTFSTCSLNIVIFANLQAAWVSSTSGSGHTNDTFVTPGLELQYSTDGGTVWTSMGFVYTHNDSPANYDLLFNATSQNAVTILDAGPINQQSIVNKKTYSATIPSSAFSVGLGDLKVKIIASTCTNSTVSTSYSDISYAIYDIQARLA